MGFVNFKKRYIFLLIGFLALLALALIALPLNEEAVPAHSETVSLTIIHTNDVHGRIWEEEQAAMGYMHMAAKVKEARETNENVLLLDAGDTFHGSSAASLSLGESIVKIMNGMGYDAMVPGNHDFGYGWQRLRELSGLAGFPVLAANVRESRGNMLLEPSTVKELNGIRVGIFGLTTLETLHKTHPRNVEGLLFDDPVQSAREIVEELRDDCDFLIALAHLPLTDTEDSCARLADEVDGIDLIVSGHYHVPLDGGMVVNDVYIVQAGEYGGCLGLVDIVFENKIAREINPSLYLPAWTEAGLKRDGEIEMLIAGIEQESELYLSEVIGRTEIFLDGEREHVRTRETNLGKLVAEAMVRATGADAALTNGGGIRTSIKEGEITKRDILNVLPFNNYVVVKEVEGSDIVQALEHGVSLYPEPGGRYPQVAGIEFTFAPEKEPGSRVGEVKVAGQELDPERMYKLALNDFNAAGGDGYTMLAKSRLLGEFGSLSDMVIEYIQKISTEAAPGTLKLPHTGRTAN
jgi:5'-nucleotidase